ncbi:MAG TPA: thiamine pyrophosphate-dependent enzyme [Candidatus Wallbacteria bacterium]|nr:thiamine pyrophosphate-dependent enzyme [Candidatus Wallbacteria bacterium]
MKKVATRPKCLSDRTFHYCPGCTHGVVHRLVAETIDELAIQEKTIGVAPVGCSVFAYWYFNTDFSQAAHGRAPAVATGIKRSVPGSVVFTYQGDGDLAAIGTAEIIHAANRGEKITVIFINNAIYGMTGGQMAPTSLINQKTQTSPYGRDSETMGYPIRVSEMLSGFEGVKYLSRVAVDTPANIVKAKAAIKKAFQTQLEGKGFSMVEVLSICPTDWGMNVPDSKKWLQENMIPYYPLKEFKAPKAEDAKGGE